MNINYNKGIPRVPKGVEPPNDLVKLHMKIDMTVDIARQSYEKCNNKKIDLYSFVEEVCNIVSATYKSMQNGKRRWTRAQLGKLCVGLGLTPEQADELFVLQEGKLSMTNNLDIVIYYALKDKDSVFDFCKEVKERIGKDIDSFK